MSRRQPRSDERLRRTDRLLLSRDFQRVARQGRRIASRDLVLLIAPARHSGQAHAGPVHRLGVTASRKVGPAVVRTRVKRGIREWFRRSRQELGEDVDVVVIARSGAARLAGAELSAELLGLSRRAARG
jgi:ribonuclease P protein component